MRYFISSVIAGFEPFREAAADAIRSLGLGERYGSVQATGKSPTHEEFEGARDLKPVFAFIQLAVEPEERQKAFIDEVRDWSTGRYTGQFTDAESLRTAVTTAIHRWEVESASARIDPDEMASRAIAGLPRIDRHHDASMFLSVVGAPRQTILRPSQIEDSCFQRDLQQRALFGSPSLFDTREGIEISIRDHALRLRQAHQSIVLSEDGSLLLESALPHSESGLSAVIEEDVHAAILRTLTFSGGLLDALDSTEKLSRLAVALALRNSGGGEWRTRTEHQQNPNSMRMSLGHDDTIPRVTLSPPDRARAAFRQTYTEMAEDLMVLLRRHFQD